MKTPGYIKFVWVIAGLFLGGAVGNVFGFWGPQDWKNAITGLGISFSLFYYGWFFRSQLRQTQQFGTWLVENKNALRSGTVLYGDFIVTMDTEVSQYTMVVSLIKVCLPIHSRLFVRGKENGRAFWTSLLFTMATLLLGWWEIPWGPLNTVRAVFRNIRGGKVETIGTLMEALAPSEDQWIFIHLPTSTDPSRMESDLKKIGELLKTLTELAFEKRVGGFHGYGSGSDEYILRFCGRDADQLFAALKKPLSKSRFRQNGFVVKHYGRIDDTNAREVKVNIGDVSSKESGIGLIRED